MIKSDGNATNPRLSAAHIRELAESGITPEAATAAGVYTETDPAKVGKLLNWTGAGSALGDCLVYPYLDATGTQTGYHRLKPATPRTSKKDEDKGKAIKYEAPKAKANRLYIPPGTRAALADPNTPLVFTEGEKKALATDAAGFACLSVPGVWAWQKKRPTGADGRRTGPRELIDDMQAVAWEGRRVSVAFDSDAAVKPGVLAAERSLATALRAVGAVVQVVRVPGGRDGKKQGLDDYLTANGPDALRDLLTKADIRTAADSKGGSGDEDEKGAKPNAADQLARIAADEADLWHDSKERAFASVGQRSMAVKSRPFKQWLTGRFRALNGGRVPNAEAIGNAVNAIEAAAVYDGAEFEAHGRIACHDGRVYLHLADAADTVIEVDATGWRECSKPPVRFRRASGSQALPRPEAGGSLDDLRRLLNLDDGDQFTLIVGFLCGAMMPGQPVPLLVANGEQGSGKTTVTRVLKAMIDPNAAPVRCEPKEVRDLMIAAANAHLLALDNLSHLPGWLSDALCRLSTGGGFATRELYTDDGEIIFDALRPVILNGIEEFVTRGDLLERSILLRLPTIPEEKRVPESDFWARFYNLRPKLLGAVLDRVAGGLRELPGVELDHLPRMADFARWCVACECGADEPERFLDAYTTNQSGAHEQAMDASSLAPAVVAFMNGRDGWEGTPTDLYQMLARYAPNPAPRDWPKAANSLSGKLSRLAPNLRRVHRIDYQTDRRTDSGRGRIVRLCRLPAGPSGPPEPSTGRDGHPRRPDALPDDRRSHPFVESSARPPTRGKPTDDPDGSDDPFRSLAAVSLKEFNEFSKLD